MWTSALSMRARRVDRRGALGLDPGAISKEDPHMSHGMPLRGRAFGALAIAIASNLALATVVAAAQAGPSYLAVSGWSAGATSPNTVRLSATTNGAIPKQADQFINDNVIVGIAWADLGSGTALVAT